MDSEDFSTLPVDEQLRKLCDDSTHDTFEVSLMAFCTYYEEEDNLKTLKEFFLEHPAVDRLVELVGEISNHQFFVLAIKLLARINGYGPLMQSVNAGQCLRKLLEILANGTEENKPLVLSGVKVLSYLSCEPQFALHHFDDLMTLFLRQNRLITTFAKDDDVIVYILVTLINCLFKNDTNKATFLNEGGVTELLENLQLNDTRRKTFLFVTKLFRNLCKLYDRSKLLNNPAFLSYLLDISTIFLDDTAVQENVLWTLLNLTLNSRHAKGILNRVGGIQRISSMIRSHTENETVLNLAFTLFNQVSTRTTTRVAIAKEYGVENILSNLYAWEGHHNIQLMCLKVIDVLCTLSLCRKRLIREERLPTLLKWLIQHVDDKSFISSGLNICHKLSISAAETKQALQENCFTLFTTINDVHVDDMDIINITQVAHQNSTEAADYDSEDSIEEVPSSDSSSEEDYL